MYSSLLNQGVTNTFDLIGSAINGGITGDWSGFGSSLGNAFDMSTAMYNANMSIVQSGIGEMATEAGKSWRQEYMQNKLLQAIALRAEIERDLESEDSGYNPPESLYTKWSERNNATIPGTDIKWGERKFFNEVDDNDYKALLEAVLDENGNVRSDKLEKLLALFKQSVTSGEDIVDKCQRIIDQIKEKITNKNFAMITSSKDKDLLATALSDSKALIDKAAEGTAEEKRKAKLEADTKFNNAVNTIVSNNPDNKTIKDGLFARYASGLRYMNENEERGAVYIGSNACAVISNYIYGMLKGNIDPSKTSYEQYYINKLETGKIGGDSYGAPVVNTFDNMEKTLPLWFGGNIYGSNVFGQIISDVNTPGNPYSVQYMSADGTQTVLTETMIAIEIERNKQILNENSAIMLNDALYGSPVSMDSILASMKAAEALDNLSSFEALNENKQKAMKDYRTFNSSLDGNSIYMVQRVDGIYKSGTNYGGYGHFYLVGKDSRTGKYTQYDFNLAGTRSYAKPYTMDSKILRWLF